MVDAENGIPIIILLFDDFSTNPFFPSADITSINLFKLEKKACEYQCMLNYCKKKNTSPIST